MRLLLRILLVGLVSFALGPLASAADTRPIIVQSHRGAGVLAPENTVAAFELGWQLGTIPEADVRTTKDGVLVAFHDKNFARVVHHASPELKKRGVQDVTFAELAQLEVGAETQEGFARRHVSSMGEIFEVMRGQSQRQLYLDIKDVDLTALATLVKEKGVSAQVILASTKIEIIRQWKTLLPDSQTLHWMGGTEESLHARLDQLEKENFAGITQLQIHIKKADAPAPHDLSPSEDFLRSVATQLRSRAILFQALPWGGTDPALYRRLLGLGVESFATDYPEITMQVMREHRATAK